MARAGAGPRLVTMVPVDEESRARLERLERLEHLEPAAV